METQNRQVPHPLVAIRNREGHRLQRPSLRSEWAQAPYSQAPVLGRGVPTTSVCEKQQELDPGEMEGCCRLKCPPKEPEHRLNLFINSLTLGSSAVAAFQKATDVQGGTELTRFKVRMEAGFGVMETEMLAGTTAPLRPLLIQPTGTGGHQI